jgi:hypothetical protein
MYIFEKVVTVMTIAVSLNGRKRKELASAVGKILGATVTYKGLPTYEYEVGKVIIGRDGTITLNTKRVKDAKTVSRLLEGLRECGFEPRLNDETEPASGESFNVAATTDEQAPVRESDDKTPDNLVIQMPLEGFDEASLQNLRLLVDRKAALIMKALGITELTIEKTDASLDFPWFRATVSSQELAAYTNFIVALCDMAKRQKRILAVEKPTDNEKFTFRLFLVRLGLIGDEYADTRRILLQNLSGNGSWKDINGKSTHPRLMNPTKPEIEDIPDFMCTGDSEAIKQKISFIKRLGYFLLHFDD